MALVHVQASGSNLVRTGGSCDGCPDATAVSEGQIADNGFVEFIAPEQGTLRYVGLAPGGPGTSPGDLSFALRLQNGVVEVRENNVYRVEHQFAAGDMFRIAVESGGGIVVLGRQGPAQAFRVADLRGSYPAWSPDGTMIALAATIDPIASYN